MTKFLPIIDRIEEKLLEFIVWHAKEVFIRVDTTDAARFIHLFLDLFQPKWCPLLEIRQHIFP